MMPHLPGPAAILRPGAIDDPSSPPSGQPQALRLLLHQRLAAYLLQGRVEVFRSSVCHFVFWKSGFLFDVLLWNILPARVTVNFIIV